MKIAVNTRLLLPNKLEGIGWFAYQTLKQMVADHPEVEWHFIFDRKHDQQFIFADNVRPHRVGPQSRHPFLWYAWFEHSIPRLLRRIQPDIFVSPDGYLSLSTRVPQLPVIHDLNFEKYPEDLPRLYGNYYRNFFPKFARKATRIATVSEFSKSDISNKYDISPEKIDVVFNGSHSFYHEISEAEKQKTKNKWTSGKPYFYYIGSLHPRKNITRMLLAFNEFKVAGGEEELVIVGERKWWSKEMEEAYETIEHKDAVHFVGRQEPEELTGIAGAATALVYVSYFEGFGIPIVEAFNAGVPVITSNITSMPEVAGEAGILVDPFSVESIAKGMIRTSMDKELCADSVAKGKERAQLFTWQKSADRMWASIQRTLADAS